MLVTQSAPFHHGEWSLLNSNGSSDRYNSSELFPRDGSAPSSSATVVPPAPVTNGTATDFEHGSAFERAVHNAGRVDFAAAVHNMGQSKAVNGQAQSIEPLEIICGPLLNYKGLSNVASIDGPPMWTGSVLIVTKPGVRTPPTLNLTCAGRFERIVTDSARPAAPISSQSATPSHPTDNQTITASLLYSDAKSCFYRFSLCLPLSSQEMRWTYCIPSSRTPNRTFVVPSTVQSMRIMFHSCNGFSLGTSLETWKGPVLWHDVLSVHAKHPFHVMIGGGDQIYNDGIRAYGPLKEWTSLSNPKHRRDYPFGEDLRRRCDEFYFNNYVEWFSGGDFARANGEIPQINIWDDHDIIDGFGSYTDHFMQCHVFRGIGGIAQKYYMLFQHHAPPPVSTYTSDVPQPVHTHHLHLHHEKSHDYGLEGALPDPVQIAETYVKVPTPEEEDACWIIGRRPGPYVQEHSRSLYMRLGARIAFLGIDARTERTRHQVNYSDTYDLIFERISKELADPGPIRPNHLILLLGIPIAYPRLIWLENIFTSPLMGPLRLLNKRFGFGGDFFNDFDGSVDLLDDLDDHYTARAHKHERKILMLHLQGLAAKFDIRITILGGDVHLAALGRFYSKSKVDVSSVEDPRYMMNVISSAITNHPPPRAVADLLARRNKIHHLDRSTDETLLDFFDREPGELDPEQLDAKKPKRKNLATMPCRNYAILTESCDLANGLEKSPEETDIGSCTGNDGHGPLHRGEEGAGTIHGASSGLTGSGVFGARGLEVSIRVEKTPGSGATTNGVQGYGVCIPPLIRTAKTVEIGEEIIRSMAADLTDDTHGEAARAGSA